jgi:hypothetical protein
VGIEAMALMGRVGAVGTETVDRAGVGAGEVAVPDFIGAFRQFEAGELLAAGGIEETDFDFLCIR